MPRPNARLLVAIAASVLLTACLQGPATCSDTAAAEFRRLEHYGGVDLEPQPHVYGACNATFASSDDPETVLEAYASELRTSGYTVQDITSTPIIDETEGIIGQAVYLDARNDRFFVSVSGEVIERREAVYSVFVDDNEQP
ncbi:MAG: hypothetical protein ACXWWQ_07715 [Candidatus Limnocylindria bacterium]